MATNAVRKGQESRHESEAFERRVSDAIERALSDERLVGVVVLVARDGELVYRRAAGFADREAGRPVREDTLFRFASLTKPIVTAAAMAMIERGQIGLDDVVTRWLPEFRPRTGDGNEPAITLRHLLTHTAGLGYSFLQPINGPYRRAGISDGFDAVAPGLRMEEELRRLTAVPLSYAPGTAWGYSLAMDVMGEVLARASTVPLASVVERLVTGPLQMTDTGFVVHDPTRLAAAYIDDRPPRLMGDPDTVPFGEGSEIRFSPSRIFDASSFASGGAGMVGSAGDFLKFLETLRQGGGNILKPSSVRAMMSNQISELRINVEPTPSWGFGFGGAVLMDPELANVPQAAGTWKWGGVYGSQWHVDPFNRIVVVALSNTAIEGMNGGFVSDLMNAVYGT
jgi:CubicO group peptidase (beta-lactamase class C family)